MYAQCSLSQNKLRCSYWIRRTSCDPRQVTTDVNGIIKVNADDGINGTCVKIGWHLVWYEDDRFNAEVDRKINFKTNRGLNNDGRG